jgi:hypothetical protein
MYIHKAIEELGRLDDAVKKLVESKKELVERFYLYKELRKTHKVDKEIFKIMFDRLPHQDKLFNKFYFTSIQSFCYHKSNYCNTI